MMTFLLQYREESVWDSSERFHHILTATAGGNLKQENLKVIMEITFSVTCNGQPVLSQTTNSCKGNTLILISA